MPASMAMASAMASNTIACCALLLLMFLFGTSLPASGADSSARQHDSPDMLRTLLLQHWRKLPSAHKATATAGF